MTTGILTSQVVVTSAATQVVAAGTGRQQLRLRWPIIQQANVIPALGPANTVTQANGYRPILTSGPNGAQEYVIPTSGPVWAICPSGTQLTIDVMEVYS